MVEEKKLNIQVTCHIEQSKTHAVTKRKKLLKADVRQQHPSTTSGFCYKI